MLVLNRKVNQTIVLEVPAAFAGGRIILKIKKAPGAVSIGIDAPREVTVLRGEVAEKQKKLAGEH